ncbi:MAG: inositol monophosphatase family protein [Pseudomonadota bacterium]
MNDILKIMEDLARRAGRIQMERLGHAHKIEYKGSINLVTEVDHECEELIVSGIQKNFPGDDFLAEEGTVGHPPLHPLPSREGKKSKWIIDPLDGTVNYAHGFPFFCVSIALERDGELAAGVIYDPNRDELFAAEKGRGATMNGAHIRVSAAPILKQSLLATGFAYHDYNAGSNEPVANFDNFENFVRRSRAVRRPGSAATDLAWAACGRIDGFWELYLKPWDMAAGAVIIREAGGSVTAFDGGPFDLYGDEILASNGRIHDEMIEVLKAKR